MSVPRVLVGLISDTHVLLRPQAVAALRGVDAIVHAGDVGDPAILRALEAMAPTVAVRGNVDHCEWADTLPETATFECGGASIHVLHIRERLAIDPAAAAVDVVVYGHSHRPEALREGEVWFVNPGSAGPRRFTLPVTIAVVTIDACRIDVEIVPLNVA